MYVVSNSLGYKLPWARSWWNPNLEHVRDEIVRLYHKHNHYNWHRILLNTQEPN